MKTDIIFPAFSAHPQKTVNNIGNRVELTSAKTNDMVLFGSKDHNKPKPITYRQLFQLEIYAGIKQFDNSPKLLRTYIHICSFGLYMPFRTLLLKIAGRPTPELYKRFFPYPQLTYKQFAQGLSEATLSWYLGQPKLLRLMLFLPMSLIKLGLFMAGAKPKPPQID